jgi:hypothetical protein
VCNDAWQGSIGCPTNTGGKAGFGGGSYEGGAIDNRVDCLLRGVLAGSAYVVAIGVARSSGPSSESGSS